MIILPSQNEITISFVDGSFLLSQEDIMRQTEDQIEINGLMAMKAIIAALQDIVDRVEKGLEVAE